MRRLGPIGRGLIASALVTACMTLVAQDSPKVLTKAIEVRSLPAEEARKGLPVHLRGTVTFFDGRDAVFLQDETAGTFFRPEPNKIFTPGDIIEIHGTTQPGLYVPGLYLSTTVNPAWKVVGHGPLPEPIEARYSDLIAGRYHYQHVAVEGVVRSLTTFDERRINGDGRTARSLMRVAMDGEVLEVRVETGLQTAPAIDSRIRITGLVAGIINSRRQLVAPYLRIEDWSSVQILEPALPEAEVPRISGNEMLTFRMSGPVDRRARLFGTVTAVVSETLAYVRSDQNAFGVGFAQPTSLEVGDRIELMGFTDMDRFSAKVADARLLSREAGPRPLPVELRIDESIAGTHAGDLVAVTAKVTDSFRTESGPGLTLQRGGRALQVRGPLPSTLPAVGSSIRVVGVCQVESSVGTRYNASPDAVVIRLRNPADLSVMESPSPWTVRRLAAVLAVLLATVLLAALWIALLKRQVSRQTAILRVKIGSEAALQERQRIAREFHDSLEQELAGLNLRLDAVASRNMDERGRGLLETSRNLVARIQAETRNLISDLRNPAELAGDLAAALQDIADRHRERPGVEVSMTSAAGLPRLPARTVHHLRMIAGEAVTNALKHGQPTQVALNVQVDQDHLEVSVTDNGRGFDPDTETRGKAGHFGCVGIRERCRALGAKADWFSQPAEGTRFVVTLTLDPASVPTQSLSV